MSNSHFTFISCGNTVVCHVERKTKKQKGCKILAWICRQLKIFFPSSLNVPSSSKMCTARLSALAPQSRHNSSNFVFKTVAIIAVKASFSKIKKILAHSSEKGALGWTCAHGPTRITAPVWLLAQTTLKLNERNFF